MTGIKDWFFFLYKGRKVQFYCHEDRVMIGKSSLKSESMDIDEKEV